MSCGSYPCAVDPVLCTLADMAVARGATLEQLGVSSNWGWVSGPMAFNRTYRFPMIQGGGNAQSGVAVGIVTVQYPDNSCANGGVTIRANAFGSGTFTKSPVIFIATAPPTSTACRSWGPGQLATCSNNVDSSVDLSTFTGHTWTSTTDEWRCIPRSGTGWTDKCGYLAYHSDTCYIPQ